MFILGINAYHGDAAAAIVRDGELIVRSKVRVIDSKMETSAVIHWGTIGL
jgi:predicted NodU family carbamoyl transferase